MEVIDLEPKGHTALELNCFDHVWPLVFFSYFIQHPQDCSDTGFTIVMSHIFVSINHTED